MSNRWSYGVLLYEIFTIGKLGSGLQLRSLFTAPFHNTRHLLNQRSRVSLSTIILAAPLGHRSLLQSFQKSRPWDMSGRLRSILFGSFFQSSLVVAVLMIYGNQKDHRLLVFKIRVLLKGAEIYVIKGDRVNLVA